MSLYNMTRCLKAGLLACFRWTSSRRWGYNKDWHRPLRLQRAHLSCAMFATSRYVLACLEPFPQVHPKTRTRDPIPTTQTLALQIVSVDVGFQEARCSASLVQFGLAS